MSQSAMVEPASGSRERMSMESLLPNPLPAPMMTIFAMSALSNSHTVRLAHSIPRRCISSASGTSKSAATWPSEE